MEHNASFSDLCIPQTAAITVLLAFLTFNIVLWAHIKQQEETIFKLQTEIAALEHHRAMEELNRQKELRRLSYEELFRRIDNIK